MNAVIEQINSTGKTFVNFVWPMLWQSCVLIAILLAVDFLLRRKVRAVFRYWLWMLVLAKLVLPTSLSSPVSIGNFLDEPAAVNITATEQPVDNVISNVQNPSPITIKAFSEQLDLPSASPIHSKPIIPVASLTWQGGLLVIWLAVVVVMVLLLLQRIFFVYGLIRQSVETNGLMNDTLKFCCKLMGVNQTIGLKVSPNATSPAVCGLFRPVILLPKGLGSSVGIGSLRMVLMHELAHIKRGDLWVNLVQTLLQIVYFYNPLLWLANRVIRRVREQAVDEAVQVALGEKASRYPETLLNVARLVFERPALSLRLVGVVESKSALTDRIKRMITQPIPKTAKLGIIGSVALLLLAVVLLPMAKAKDDIVADDYSLVTVQEGVGFDGFVVGDPNCTGEFIKSKMGTPDKEFKDEQKGWGLVYHKKSGLDFWLNLKKRPDMLVNTLYEIRLNKGFNGKLTSGISMSSTKQDVFKVYGKPIREEVVDDLTKHFDDRVLFIRKPNFAKIHYDDKGLLFWFDGDKMNQIRVGVVSPAGSNKDSGNANRIGELIEAKPGKLDKENKNEKEGWWGNFLPDIFIMGPGSAFKEITALTQDWTGNKTGRLHKKEHYDEIFVGPYQYKTETGDLIVLVFSLDTNDRIPTEYADLLPQPWSQIEERLKQGETIEMIGKARGLNVIVLAAPRMEQMSEVIAKSKSLHNPKQFVSSIGRGSDPGVKDFKIEYDQERMVYSVTVSIQNYGTVDSPKFIVNFYLGDPIKAKPMTHGAGPIEPGKVWNERSMPFGLKEGVNEIFVVLDPANLVEESNETNNRASMIVVIKDGRIAEKKVLFSSTKDSDKRARELSEQVIAAAEFGEKPESDANSARVGGAGDIELSYDDGKKAGMLSIAGGGHCVKFTAPGEGKFLKAVKIYGSRYGEVEPPAEDFHVWLCDPNFEMIKELAFPYSEFKTRGLARWVTLDIEEQIPLPQEFIICAGFDPHQAKGVHVYYDGQASKNSFTGLPGGNLEPFNKGNWMIRAVAAKEAQTKPRTKRSAPTPKGPPVIIRTTPAAFANDVSPTLKAITATFDQTMMDKSWAWTGGGETYPKKTGQIRYDESKTTCTLPVELEPGKVYWVGINSPSYQSFVSTASVPAKRYVILFATKGKDGKPTPIPQDLLDEAKEINARSGAKITGSNTTE